MIRSEQIEQICAELYEAQPDWANIVDKLKTSPWFNIDREYWPEEYRRFMSNIHIGLHLERIAEECPEFGMEFWPSNTTFDSKDYIFAPNNAGEVNVFSKKQKNLYLSRKKEEDVFKTIYQYAKLVLVKNVPVVIDIKLYRWSVGGRNKCGINNKLTPEVYKKKLKPARQAFGTDAGYIIVIPHDIHKEKVVESNYLADKFRGAGGFLIPFYTDRETFTDDVVSKVREAGFKIKLRQENGAQLSY